MFVSQLAAIDEHIEVVALTLVFDADAFLADAAGLQLLNERGFEPPRIIRVRDR